MSGTRLRILMYHRVLTRPGHGNPGLVSAFASAFDAQMRHVAKRYCVLGADEVLDAVRDARRLPARSVLITFDDAYRDFGEVAWPILRRYGLPATLFVPTAYPDDPSRDFWWDRLYRAFAATRCVRAGDEACGTLDLRTPDSRYASLRRVQALVKTLPHAPAMTLVDRLCHQLGETAHVPADVHTWEELRQLAAEGVTIGAHSRTHAALTRLTPHDARAEIVGSRDDVRRELGRAPRVFAYPYGDHDGRVARLVREAGFEMAVTCRPGHNLLHSADPVRLSRSNVTPRSSGRVFRLRLLAAGATLERWHHAWRNRLRKAPEERSAAVAPPSAEPRIAYIMSRFPKLSETFVLNEMRAVARTGAQVDVYPLLRERQAVSHPETAAWVARARFHPFLSIPIVRANAHFLRTRPLRYLRAWTEALLGTLGSANFFFGALGILPKAVRFAYETERNGVSHVHAHFATHPAVAALVIHRLTGVPFSFTAHGSDLHVDRRMLARKVAAASFAVTVSRFNKEVMVATCGEPLRDRIHVIHCGVDPGDFAPATRSAAPPLRIVCVASLEAVKGHRFLIDACRRLVERHVEFECDLVGDGPLRPHLAARIAGAGLDGRVRLAGAQPRATVARLLSQAHVAVLASHPTPDGKREGIPVALMEAMAAGLPVVATRISGIPELVEPEVTGVLVPSGDPAALAEALARLAADAELRERLGAEGRRTVTRAFNLESSARELLALIASAGGARLEHGRPTRIARAVSVGGELNARTGG